MSVSATGGKVISQRHVTTDPSTASLPIPVKGRKSQPEKSLSLANNQFIMPQLSFEREPAKPIVIPSRHQQAARQSDNFYVGSPPKRSLSPLMRMHSKDVAAEEESDASHENPGALFLSLPSPAEPTPAPPPSPVGFGKQLHRKVSDLSRGSPEATSYQKHMTLLGLQGPRR